MNIATTYRQEFPDFGELDVALPEGFHDHSWHNDAMPSFCRDHWESSDTICIWVDFADKTKREFQGQPRFLIQRFNANTGKMADLLRTDEWMKVLTAVGILFPNPRYWQGTPPPEACQMCKAPLNGTVVDACTSGGWAFLCGNCHTTYGRGFGQGRGQQYERQISGKWLKTAG